MNTINNQFAKVFNFPDGQLLLMLQYDVHSVASNKPEMTYLVMVTEHEDSVAEIKRRYVNIYEARDVFAAYPENQARIDYEFWQAGLKNAGTDIRLNMPANEKSGHGHHHS
jgi:hypothetical protein